MSTHKQKKACFSKLNNVTAVLGDIFIGFDEDVVSKCGIPKYTSRNLHIYSSPPVLQRNSSRLKSSCQKVRNTNFHIKNVSSYQFRDCTRFIGSSLQNIEKNLLQYGKHSEIKQLKRKNLSQKFMQMQSAFGNQNQPEEKLENNKIYDKTYPIAPNYWIIDNVNEKNKNTLDCEKMSKVSKEKHYKPVDGNIHANRDTAAPSKKLIIEEKDAISGSDTSAVLEVRSNWLLDSRWLNSSLNELKQGFGSLNMTTRLESITASTLVILRNQNATSWIKENRLFKEDAIEEIKGALNDDCNVISFAAAVCLQSLSCADALVIEKLEEMLQCGQKPEQWISAQCLAKCNVYDHFVLRELISAIGRSDIRKKKKAIQLLKAIDSNEGKLTCYISERLNSSRWKERITACKVLSLISTQWKFKDLAYKLSHLMWNDWNKEVRIAAIKCLGSTSHGEIVHNTLCKNLDGPDEAIQLKSLKIIACLGLSTPHTNEAVKKCLHSDSPSLSINAIKTVGTLKLRNEEIIGSICGHVLNNKCWKVKLYAIRALALIGVPALNVQECLTWALRFEKQPIVRLEACQAIASLQLRNGEVINAIQSSIMMEEKSFVRSKMATTLYNFHTNPSSQDLNFPVVKDIIHSICNKEYILKDIIPPQLLEKCDVRKDT